MCLLLSDSCSPLLCIAGRLIPAGCVLQGMLRTSFQTELSSEIGEQEKERNQGTSPHFCSGWDFQQGLHFFLIFSFHQAAPGMILVPTMYPWLCILVLYNVKSYKEAWPLEHHHLPCSSSLKGSSSSQWSHPLASLSLSVYPFCNFNNPSYLNYVPSTLQCFSNFLVLGFLYILKYHCWYRDLQ